MALLLVWHERPDDEAARAAIRRFCSLSSEHRAAWDEAKRVFRVTGVAVGADRRQRHGRVNRRQVTLGLGLMALLGVGALSGPRLWRGWRADIITGVAEVRAVQLADGSLLSLGPDSAIAVTLAPSERRITLLEGMIMCNVAKDSARPFVVATVGLTATAVGTRFEVARNAGVSRAAVEEGRVGIALDGAATWGTLGAGDWLSVETGNHSVRRGRGDPAQVGAWRQNLVTADQDTIENVVAQIARWHRGRVLIADPGLASAPVSGLFDLNDPDAALEAVVKPYGGKVRHISPWLTVLSSI
ncbi:FecR domain-containing protein [Aquabacter sp. L1I39]|uniref:FecR family protein n=1 Tax=Aquabacter sp. L1I39 TaxID=2820278 RepID=UPI001AD9B782|nr:FecR domain-containing protein [Aquabacter sp. L1I39]QTL03288.1 FecR domain-containing protein [Aquabacter sp. L1I39]